MNPDKFTVEIFKDHRAIRYFDVFPELSGQVSISVIMPHQYSGWHKHDRQTDQFFVAKGTIKVGIITPTGVIIEEVLTAEHPHTIVISPSHWHAWKSLEEETILVYYLSHKHDEADEIRETADTISARYNYQL